jgi:hypothetical protein
MSGHSIKWQRLLTFAALAVAFAFMASIFSPDTTRAGETRPGVSSWTPRSRTSDSSVDPHQGLNSLGQIEGLQHTVQIYDTPLGARFTIFDCQSDEIVGTLLTAEDVERFFPEISIRGIQFDAAERTSDTDSIGPLMLAEPVCPDQW